MPFHVSQIVSKDRECHFIAKKSFMKLTGSSPFQLIFKANAVRLVAPQKTRAPSRHPSQRVLRPSYGHGLMHARNTERTEVVSRRNARRQLRSARFKEKTRPESMAAF
jgi:hypothetical protein